MARIRLVLSVLMVARSGTTSVLATVSGRRTNTRCEGIEAVMFCNITTSSNWPMRSWKGAAPQVSGPVACVAAGGGAAGLLEQAVKTRAGQTQISFAEIKKNPGGIFCLLKGNKKAASNPKPLCPAKENFA